MQSVCICEFEELELMSVIHNYMLLELTEYDENVYNSASQQAIMNKNLLWVNR